MHILQLSLHSSHLWCSNTLINPSGIFLNSNVCLLSSVVYCVLLGILLPALQSRKDPQKNSRETIRLTSLVSPLSDCSLVLSVVQYLTTVSCILFMRLIIYGSRASSVPVVPSWPETEFCYLFFSFSFLFFKLDNFY